MKLKPLSLSALNFESDKNFGAIETIRNAALAAIDALLSCLIEVAYHDDSLIHKVEPLEFLSSTVDEFHSFWVGRFYFLKLFSSFS